MVWHDVAQARHFSECRVFAYKGTRTRCGGSADLSAVVDCASCYATTNIGRVLAIQASLELTLTPYSIPSVSPPNQTTLVCSRSADRSSSPVVLIGWWSSIYISRVAFLRIKGLRSKASQLLSYLHSLQTSLWQREACGKCSTCLSAMAPPIFHIL